MSDFRVRFAPSPTGPLHIGGVRTALYNYLLAKKIGGKFILRIEDTDQRRYVPEAEGYILEALQWCGMEMDEGPSVGGPFGPYRQSERKHLYTEYTHRLVEFGHAYYAFDTPQELEEMRERAAAAGDHAPRYDHQSRKQMRNSLTISQSEVEALLKTDTPYTVRLKVDPDQTVTFEDEVRGSVSFSTNELDDKVLMKADGMPTYHLANVVDDHLMKISHVIRGEEWLSSTAHHVLLYRAFGWEDTMPQFAHLPLILKPTGKGKLSKRDGQKFGFPVFPLDWRTESERFIGFREVGFDSVAMINFLAFLGWNPGTDQEIFSKNELINSFKVSQIVKSGARFDYDKACWFNQQHILRKTPDELMDAVRAILKKQDVEVEDGFLESFIKLLQPRVEVYPDFYTKGYYFFESVKEYDRKMLRKKWKQESPAYLEDLTARLYALNQWEAALMDETVRKYIDEQELKFGDILPILRLALSGTTKGPDLYPMMQIMGREKVLNRLQEAPSIFESVLTVDES